jgi:EAL domain-containing protein (putative c-di-GMP-specific phosphodiesterase class I)
MLSNSDDLAILNGVIGLADAFHLDIIAEGVETIAQGEALIRMGCQIGQGYVIAHPMPADNIVDWIESWEPDSTWKNVTG